MKINKRFAAAAMTAALLAVSAGPAPAAKKVEADKSDNVKLLDHFPYDNPDGNFFAGGTDIDFSGKYVYAMQQGAKGGVHVFENAKKPKKVAFIPCPGEQNDVAVVKPGLIALGYHNSTCGEPGGGVRLLDVRNPKRAMLLGAVNDLPGGTHTLTTYPGKDIIYASPGGLPTNGGGVQQIIDVSDPKKPEVAATFRPTPSGCHDFSFLFTKDAKLGFCPGFQSTTIFDVSDPLAPVMLSAIPNPTQFFQHSAVATFDGKYLVVGDENFVAHECAGGPTGAIWIYDITNPSAPKPAGYYGIDRGPTVWGTQPHGRGQWCTAHNYNFIPGTYTLVMSWYASGMNVLDISDPANVKEIAHYMEPDGKSNYWSAYWYGGRIWASDRVDGLDVFEVKGLKEGKKR